MSATKSSQRFVVCIRNRGYPASLEARKIYRRVEDRKAAQLGLVRVVDESGEAYLYPAGFFVPIRMPPDALRALRRRR